MSRALRLFTRRPHAVVSSQPWRVTLARRVPPTLRVAAAALALTIVLPSMLGGIVDRIPQGRLTAFAAGAAPPAPVFHPDPTPVTLRDEFTRKKFTLDAQTGNYLSPKVTSKTKHDDLVPVLIDNRYLRDLRGQPVFLRASIRDKLLVADKAMFAKKKAHLVITYGFRSNSLQQELYSKINGKGKVAEVGGSFHEAGMALDLSNWRDAQHFMIDAGFVGGCYGIEEDLVHYSIDEINKASNMDAFKRCTLKEIPENILKGVKTVGRVTGRAGKATFGKLKGK